MAKPHPLSGTHVVITRPAGTGTALARAVRALGGSPLLLPGSSLRPPDDMAAARMALREALACDAVIFTSPAAARFASRLVPLHTRASVFAPGAGTRRALQRTGIDTVTTPAREDSEGLLALAGLTHVRGKRVGIVGAAGGRGLLDRDLAARGARVAHAHVYRRRPARLGQRHADALQRTAGARLYVLLSSAEALANILAGLPDAAGRILLAGSAVASSERLVRAARDAGFRRVLRAPSAHAAALLATVAGDAGPAR